MLREVGALPLLYMPGKLKPKLTYTAVSMCSQLDVHLSKYCIDTEMPQGLDVVVQSQSIQFFSVTERSATTLVEWQFGVVNLISDFGKCSKCQEITPLSLPSKVYSRVGVE